MNDKKTKFNELKYEIWESYVFMTNCMCSSSGVLKAKAVKYDLGKAIQIYASASQFLLNLLFASYFHEGYTEYLKGQVIEELEDTIDHNVCEAHDLNEKVKNNLDAVRQSSAYLIVIDRLLKIRNLALEYIASEEESK